MDRNCYLDNIEITQAVALRKESVDRNKSADVSYSIIVKSLSARRAWIEISSLDDILAGVNVALRKESVDRNGCNRKNWVIYNCRSPQGERG